MRSNIPHRCGCMTQLDAVGLARPRCLTLADDVPIMEFYERLKMENHPVVEPSIASFDARLVRVESAVETLKIDVAVIRSNYVTKEDLIKAMLDQNWKYLTWLTGICTALTVAVYSIARYVH